MHKSVKYGTLYSWKYITFMNNLAIFSLKDKKKVRYLTLITVYKYGAIFQFNALVKLLFVMEKVVLVTNTKPQ